MTYDLSNIPGIELPETSTKNHEITPAGTFIARCSKIIDLWTQEDEYKWEIKHIRKINLHFELVDELNSDGKPFTIFREFSYSMWENSNLRKFLESWRGSKYLTWELEAFNIFREYLTRSCQITIEHKTSKKTGNEYAVINSVAPLLKGIEAKELSNDPVWFNLNFFQQETFDNFPEKVKEIIAKSPEYQKLNFNSQDGISLEDIPF